MSGVLNAMVGRQSGTRIIVTTASSGSARGFSSITPGAFGSISPTTYRGETFNEAYGQVATSVFRLSFTNDALARSFFSQIWIYNDAGAVVTLKTADADFVNIGGSRTTWQWNGDGTSPWASAGVDRAFWLV